MNELIDYATVKSTRAMFAAHLLNARILVGDPKLIEEEAFKRFGLHTEGAVLEVFREASDTLTVARRQGLNCAEPIGTHKGNEFGVVRGRVTFVKHFERNRSLG